MSELPDYKNVSINPKNLACQIYFYLKNSLVLIDIICAYDSQLQYTAIFHKLRSNVYFQFELVFPQNWAILENYNVSELYDLIPKANFTNLYNQYLAIECVFAQEV